MASNHKVPEASGGRMDRNGRQGFQKLQAENDQPANNDVNNADPPYNQALVFNRGLANMHGHDEDEDDDEHEEGLGRNPQQDHERNPIEELAINPQEHGHNPQPDNMAQLNQDNDEEEPSNFQAWYVRSANNSRNRERADLRGEQSADSEPDQDMEDNPMNEAAPSNNVDADRRHINVFDRYSLAEEINYVYPAAAGNNVGGGEANPLMVRADQPRPLRAGGDQLEYILRNLSMDGGAVDALANVGVPYQQAVGNAAAAPIQQAEFPAPFGNQNPSVYERHPSLPLQQGSPEPQATSSNANIASPTAGTVPRRNTSYVRNVNHGAGSLYNWQATKTTVKDRISFMFNNEILADVHFKVGRGGSEQRIPAHKFVLSVGSAVFDAMFNSTLATQEDEITIPDVEPAAFLAMLRFLYSDEVNIGPETVMTTLYTAKKYAVPALEKHCVDFLKRNLSSDNAFMLLTQARLFDEPQLAALCLETIDKNTPEALNADGFTDIDIDTLAAVLDRDSLRVKESKLFSAVLRWSEAECQRQSLPLTSENKRSVLGRVLKQIRFPLMSVEEFAQGPAQSGILTDRETVSLFLHFTVNPKPPVGFLDVPRCLMIGKEQIVNRFQQIESRWGYSGTSDKIRFIVDRRIFVVGFGLYGSIHGPSEYDVTIQLLHSGSGRLLGSNELTFSSDGSNNTFRAMFKEEIEILPNINYTAVSTLKGLDSHYGTKGLRKVTVDCNNGGKVTFQFSYAAGNNNGTSVEDGQIPEIIFYT